MRLATIDRGDGTFAAVHTERGAIPVTTEDGASIADVGALLRTGRADALARAALATGTPVAVQDDQLRRPVLAPGAVVCLGLNYREHILEMGRELPTEPTLFSKLPRALTDPFADVRVPRSGAAALDYEGELGIVIGAPGRDVSSERAWELVAGLTVINDVTMRDYQRRTTQWFAGKSWQASTPVGPWVVTRDELGDVSAMELVTRVNGDVRQRAPIGDLVFDVPTVVSDLSTIVELEPGDIIATGTPGGVGDPQGLVLGDGDEVEVAISGIGAIRNRVRIT